MSRFGIGAATTIMLLGLMIPIGAAAQRTPPILVALNGSWSGTGELFSRPASFSMRWEVEDSGVAVLSFANAMVNEDGTETPILQAKAIYRAEADSVRGVWIDSRNERLELNAVVTPSSLTTTWKSSSEQGRTEYRMEPDGTVEVLDYVQTDDGWRHFGTARYQRDEGTPPPRPD